MNREEEKQSAPINTNNVGKRGHEGMKNQDLGRVTFIDEIISKVEAKSSTLRIISRKIGSHKTFP